MGQTRRVGGTNQVNRLHNAFRLCVLQASLSRHSREYTPSSTSSEQSNWSKSDFWFFRSTVRLCAYVRISSVGSPVYFSSVKNLSQTASVGPGSSLRSDEHEAFLLLRVVKKKKRKQLKNDWPFH